MKKRFTEEQIVAILQEAQRAVTHAALQGQSSSNLIDGDFRDIFAENISTTV